LGYKRSAKKCKEKFENVHKYYKRTKEGRAGRQDGKSYRFFDELEALHAAAPQPQPQPQQQQPASSATPLHAFAAPVSAPAPMSSMPPPPPGPMQPAPISSAGPAPVPAPAPMELPSAQQPLNLQGLSFSSMSESESDDEFEDDDDMTAETGGSQQDHLGKRKRGGRAGGSKKMMSFFEGLMQQVVQRQEEMQRRFLETMEKREAERTAREEAWRRQEVARLNREQEQLVQERAAAASRDAAIINFLHRIGGQSVQPPAAVAIPMPVQTPPPPKQPPRQPQHPPPPSPPATTPQSKPISAAPLQQQPKETAAHRDAGTPLSAPPTSGASSLEPAPVTADQHVDSGLRGGDGGAASSSRWPKTEVHALIQLRMDMDMRYHETGPKGPLWEEISSGMRRLGYNRSSKRCKEKWENINKYYKKVKESNKKRPEDSKTCPYFHQLEAIYNMKHLRSGGAASASNVAIAAAPPGPPAFHAEQVNATRQEIEGKNINDVKRNNGGSGAAVQVPSSNGEKASAPPAAFDADSGMKKVKTLCAPINLAPSLIMAFPSRSTEADRICA
jgi:hypothetical protein